MKGTGNREQGTALAAVLTGILAWIALASGLAFGQSFSAAISGVVRDASGAVVPQATVTVRNTETALTRVTETGVNGGYNLPSLPVGPYELTVGKPGFRQLVRSGITLAVAQEVVLNLTLEVGQVTQTVEVTGEAPLVNTTLASTSGLINQEEIKDMPLNGRSFHQLLLLNANTVDARSNSTTGREALFSVAGKRMENNRWTMNGVDYVGSHSSGVYVAPSGISGQLLGVEAVREFNMLGHTYGAEYGKRSGGQVTIVTTSGTNQLHGTAFEFLRNDKFDARNYFSDEVPPLKRNQFGGSLGGPIIRDKMFLFGNYEAFRERAGESFFAYVPNEQARGGLLPCNVIKQDSRYQNLDCGEPDEYFRVPNLQPGMLRFLEHYWPAPNPGSDQRDPRTGLLTGTARATSIPIARTEEDFGLARFDYNIASGDTLMANFTADEGRLSDPADDPLFRSNQTRDLYTLSVQETHIFSPTVLNVATFGVSRSGSTSVSPPVNPIPEDLLLMKAPNRQNPGAFTIGGGTITVGATSLLAPNGQNLYYGNRQAYSGSNDLSLTRGRHNLKMGVWFQRVQQTSFSSGQFNAGTAAFANLLGFLQDRPDTFTHQSNPTELHFRSTEAAWYFQDEIKLRPNLTLRLGLRDEMTTGWNERDGQCSNYTFDQSGVILTHPYLGHSCFVENNALALWQPRVGVAWDPTGTGKWAVRAGFGIHNDLQDNLAQRVNANQPFSGRIQYSNLPLLGDPARGLEPLIPAKAGFAPPQCTSRDAQGRLQPAGCVNYGSGGIEPTMHTPTVQEWSLTVEREIAQDLAVQLSYVGSQSYHVVTAIDMNTVRPVRCEDPAGCRSGGVRPARFHTTVPQGTEYIPAGATRPNPLIGSTLSWFFLGNASSQGGSVSLLKRARGGLMFKTNYTFSKVLDMDSFILTGGAQNDSFTILNPYNLKLAKGIASYSLQHAFNANWSYDLPFGRGATGWVEKVLGGWQWNGIFSVRGGFPITPLAGANSSGNGDIRNPDVPNWNPNFKGKVILGVDGFKKTGQYYDPEAFELPATGTFGNFARGALRGPGLWNFDTSLFKTLPLNERFNLQFRAEFFNIFNHANFGNPNLVAFTGTGINATAGTIDKTSNSERQIQFALKLQF